MGNKVVFNRTNFNCLKTNNGINNIITNNDSITEEQNSSTPNQFGIQNFNFPNLWPGIPIVNNNSFLFNMEAGRFDNQNYLEESNFNNSMFNFMNSLISGRIDDSITNLMVGLSNVNNNNISNSTNINSNNNLDNVNQINQEEEEEVDEETLKRYHEIRSLALSQLPRYKYYNYLKFNRSMQE